MNITYEKKIYILYLQCSLATRNLLIASFNPHQWMVFERKKKLMGT